MDLLFGFLFTFLIAVLIYFFIIVTTNIGEISLYDDDKPDEYHASFSSLNLLARYEGDRQYLSLTIMHQFMRRKYSVSRAFEQFTIYIYRIIYRNYVSSTKLEFSGNYLVFV